MSDEDSGNPAIMGKLENKYERLFEVTYKSMGKPVF